MSNGGAGVNLFANPQAAYNVFRPVVLGIDGRANDLGRAMASIAGTWTLRLLTTKITERVGFTFYTQWLNAFNHMEFSDPGQYGSAGLDRQNPTALGVLNSQFNDPRKIELGLRIFF